MEDLERYGDYNETEDDVPKEKNPIGLILKILVGVLCIAVVGIIAFRVIIFNYYPSEIKFIHFNDELKNYYTETGGKIGALTQDLRAKYDDPDEGNFFCDNLVVIEGVEQLQLSVRYNLSLVEKIQELYGVDLGSEDNKLKFRLVRNPLAEDGEPVEIGRLVEVITDYNFMYKYYRLVFDDVELGLDAGENVAEWIRLEIEIEGIDLEKPYMVCVYENHEIYNRFSEYKIKNKEKPEI